jgi:hypothetical protein
VTSHVSHYGMRSLAFQMDFIGFYSYENSVSMLAIEQSQTCLIRAHAGLQCFNWYFWKGDGRLSFSRNVATTSVQSPSIIPSSSDARE